MRIRCNDAVVMALASHRLFGELAWVREMAREQAKRHLLKDGDAGSLLNCLPAEACELLLPEIPRLIKTQKATGMWRKHYARDGAYSLLKALQHAGLLQQVVTQLRYDPYAPFRDAEDCYGIAVRNKLLQAPGGDEQAVQQRLLEDSAARQCTDGSWEHTVIATVYHLEVLAEAGLSATRNFERGISYLFTCLQPEVLREKSLYNHTPVARQMISSTDRSAEYRSALALKPDWLPNGECYCHLPIMQTGYALRLLNASGYAGDPRVMQACQNLVDLRERYGGWCDTNIRLGIRAELKQVGRSS